MAGVPGLILLMLLAVSITGITMYSNMEAYKNEEPNNPIGPLVCNCSCNCCFMQIYGYCSHYCFCPPKGTGKAVVRKCPGGQMFNREKMNCDNASKDLCPDIPLTGFNCPKEGLYPHPTKCNLFIQCSNGNEHIQVCPANLHFSVEFSRCEHEEIAKCRVCEEGTISAHPETCENYILCQNGQKQIHKCELNYHFCETCNPPACTRKAVAKCERKKCDPKKLYRDSESCNRFYLCANGKKVLMNCSINTEFCEHCNACEHPEIANCSISKKPFYSGKFQPEGEILADFLSNQILMMSPYFSYTNIGGNSMHCPLPDGVYPVPADRSLYLQCRHQVGAFFKCPPLEEFDEELRACLPSSAGGWVGHLSPSQCSSFMNSLP